MKKLSFFIAILALLFLLTGCGQEPEYPFQGWDYYRVYVPGENAKTSIQANEQDVLDACGAAIRDIQAQDSILLYDFRTFEGEGAFSPSTQFLYWKHGEDWMEKCLAHIWTPARGGVYQDTQFTYLYKDGECFIGVENGILGPESYVTLGWWGDEMPSSWLLACDWDAQNPELVSAFENQFGKSYVLKFATPYELHNTSYRAPATTQDYTVEFYFNKEGQFEKAVMIGNYIDPVYLGESRANVTITDILAVASTYEPEIADHIEAETRNPFTKSVFDSPDRNYLF